jgi:hypothetical protein
MIYRTARRAQRHPLEQPPHGIRISIEELQTPMRQREKHPCSVYLSLVRHAPTRSCWQRGSRRNAPAILSVTDGCLARPLPDSVRCGAPVRVYVRVASSRLVIEEITSDCVVNVPLVAMVDWDRKVCLNSLFLPKRHPENRSRNNLLSIVTEIA